jgi:hypothetical protein
MMKTFIRPFISIAIVAFIIYYTAESVADLTKKLDIRNMDKPYTLQNLQWIYPVKNQVNKTAQGIQVVTNVSSGEYQLMSQIPAKQLKSVALHFVITVQRGGVGIGILNNNQQKWIAQKSFSGAGTYEDTIATNLTNDANVTIVVANNQSQPATSEFVVKQVDVYTSPKVLQYKHG